MTKLFIMQNCESSNKVKPRNDRVSKSNIFSALLCLSSIFSVYSQQALAEVSGACVIASTPAVNIPGTNATLSFGFGDMGWTGGTPGAGTGQDLGCDGDPTDGDFNNTAGAIEGPAGTPATNLTLGDVTFAGASNTVFEPSDLPFNSCYYRETETGGLYYALVPDDPNLEWDDGLPISTDPLPLTLYTCAETVNTNEDPRNVCTLVEFAETDDCSNTPPGITLTPPVGNTSEDETTTTFTLVLDTQPTGEVNITITSADDSELLLSVDGNSSTPLESITVNFTTAIWDTPQTITVHGVDDDIIDGDQVVNISFENIQNGDNAYNGLAIEPISVTNTDNDEAASTSSPANIPVFGPLGLLASIFGLLWFGNRRRKS